MRERTFSTCTVASVPVYDPVLGWLRLWNVYSGAPGAYGAPTPVWTRTPSEAIVVAYHLWHASTPAVD
jgi:hypothetical protein